MSNLLEAALFYKKQGFSVIAIGDNKRAIFSWTEFQTEIASDEVLATQFNSHRCKSLAVIGGAVSGGLEIIDVDLKYDVSGTLWDRLQAELGDYLNLCYIVQTKSGGYHLYYRCEVVEGNQKLAMRHATDKEKKDNPHVKEVVLIETRGEKGYVLAPPSDGYTKITKKFDIQVISIEQRDAILSVCRSFNEVIKEDKAESRPVHQPNANFKITPWDDYNEKCDVISLLEKHGWTCKERKGERQYLKRPGETDSPISADYHLGLNLFKVFSTSTVFEVGKGYKPYAIYTILEHNGDYSKSAKQLIEDGYGQQGVALSANVKKLMYEKKEEGMSNKQIADYIKKKHRLSETQSDDLEEALGDDILTFWQVTSKMQIVIVRSKMQDFLASEGGFFLYYFDPKHPNFKMVRVVDGFVSEATTEHIKKFIKDYIDDLPEHFDGITRDDLKEAVYKGSDAYFGKGLLEFMPSIKLNLLKDTKDAAYFPFMNGIVRVTKEKKELLKYGELGLHVWRDQVINFKIDIDSDIDYDNVEYLKFIQCISDKNEERVGYAISLIGYLLHKYKDPTKPFAVILAEETEKDKDGGGTGKGIFFKGISKLLNVVFVDGKNFKLDKSFAFQRVELSTQLIVIEDCRKSVDFEGFYSNITEGVTVEKKNKDEMYITYTDAPKFGFTTNYTINLVGNHAKRRAKIIEFSSFFSPKRTPLDHFGKSLFDDWDSDEWNRFYNFMIESVQVYMNVGVPMAVESETMKRKQIKNQFGEFFLEYFTELKETHKEQWLSFSAEYSNFLGINELEKKEYSQIKFKKGLEVAADILGIVVEQRRNRQNNSKMEFKLNEKK